MTRRHCSRKTRNLMKFRDSYDEEYAWEEIMEGLSLKKKKKNRHRKNKMKEE